jgi:aspartyl-tRNA(Asn)/glutamyl-tRNA(Gln) amidotransferase subunit C
MSDVLGPGEVERIATLARLSLSDDEKALYARQLTRILDYARQIAALDTSGVSPTARVDEGAAAERPDEPRPSLPREAALQNAPESLAGLFVVPPAIVGEDEA